MSFLEQDVDSPGRAARPAPRLFVDSEVGPLRRVLLHRPDLELRPSGRCHPQRSLSGPTPLLEPAHYHDPAALGQGLGHMLGLVAPHDHGEERRLLLPPGR